MKTIKEEIKEIEKAFPGDKYEKIAFEVGFACGLDFAQRWIPIQEEFPSVYYRDIWLRSEQILAKDSEDNIFIARVYECVRDGSKHYNFYDRNDSELFNIVAWRLIEYK